MVNVAVICQSIASWVRFQGRATSQFIIITIIIFSIIIFIMNYFFFFFMSFAVFFLIFLKQVTCVLLLSATHCQPLFTSPAPQLRLTAPRRHLPTAHSISITVAEENLSSLHLFPSPLKVFWNHCLSLAFYCFPSALNLAISTSPLVRPIRLRSLASTSDFPLPRQRLTTGHSPASSP